MTWSEAVLRAAEEYRQLMARKHTGREWEAAVNKLLAAVREGE